MPPETLHTTTYGDSGPRVVFCHGLFGQGRNWTQVAKALAGDHRTLLVDLPQHGRSPWSAEFDYLAMADAVAELLSPDDPVALVGHSMGGKVAMLLALRRPELVERLCVVDVAPVPYRTAPVFEKFVEAMRGVRLDSLERRADADTAMQAGVPDPTVRSFLLQNLRHEGDTWRWQMNLDVLGDSLPEIGDWPEERLAAVMPYDGPVLWIRGETSDYVGDAHDEAMTRLFPRKRQVTIKGAGHWVHSEQPEVFLGVLRRFLNARPGA